MISPSEWMSYVQLTSHPGVPNSRDQELTSHGKKKGKYIRLPLHHHQLRRREEEKELHPFSFLLLFPHEVYTHCYSLEKLCPSRASR